MIEETMGINTSRKMPIKAAQGLIVFIERYMPPPSAEVKVTMTDGELDLLQKRDEFVAFLSMAVAAQLEPIIVPGHHLEIFRLSQAILLEAVGGFPVELAAKIYGLLQKLDENEKKD